MRLVVIGGVAAGLSAAARARRLDRSLEITVLERGDLVSYGACGLPYFVSGQVRSLNQLVTYSPEYFARERNIQVRTTAEVVSIAHARRQLTLNGGERIAYDKLVIATGARVVREIDDADQPHVFTMQTPSDGARLRAFVLERRPRTAAIIGAGYIGLEAAEALRVLGLRVKIVDSNCQALGRDDAHLTELLGKHLENHRIELRCGERVRSVETHRADVVVVAAGFRPNVELATDAGVELGRTGALRVTDRMETNLSGVYAAGDCAETNHIVTGRPVWIPLGTTANKMGRVAGANAAGARERFPGVAGTCIVRICGLDVAFTGLSSAQARENGFDPVSARISAKDRPGYFRGRPTSVELIADRRSRRLLGATVLGEYGASGRVNVVATALAARMTVDDFEQLDLAYAPPVAPVWDPLLIAAQQLMKQL
jgi:NADPH-dependent 2,4-dienoyl-CoA reductase/sulfur reductase-like enzyme